MGEDTEDDRQEKTNSLKKLYQNAILRVLMLMTGEHFLYISPDPDPDPDPEPHSQPRLQQNNTIFSAV